MKFQFTLLSLLLMVSACLADRYEITSIRSTQKDAYVDNAWLNGVLCIEVTIKANEDLPDAKQFVKAYFFGKDGNMVREERPSPINMGGGQSYSVPAVVRPGKKYTIYFGISEAIARGKNKWKNAVVVFGDKETVAAAVYPKADIEQFKFKEKDLLGKKPASK